MTGDLAQDVVVMARRSEAEDILFLGRLFETYVQRHFASLSSMGAEHAHIVLLAAAQALSVTRDLDSFMIRMPILDIRRHVTIVITRDGALPVPRLLLDLSKGNPASYPDPVWAGLFMARVVREASDIGPAMEFLLALGHLVVCLVERGALEVSGTLHLEAGPDEDHGKVAEAAKILPPVTYTITLSPSVSEKNDEDCEGCRSVRVPESALKNSLRSLRERGYDIRSLVRSEGWVNVVYAPHGPRRPARSR